jgi:hypothetical protein
MRICYTSDLHGDARLYQQLEDLLRAETPDLLILGGDLLPDGERDDPLGTQVAFLERVLMPRVAVWKAAAPRQSALRSGRKTMLSSSTPESAALTAALG